MKTRSLLLLLLALLASCSRREAKEKVDALPEIYPDYIGVTVPRNICPLNFSVHDATFIQAVIVSDKGETLSVSGTDHVEIPEEAWRKTLSNSPSKASPLREDLAGSLMVTVSAWSKEHPEGVTYKPFPIYVSNDDIDPWIAYRLIPPGYESWNKMGIYQRDLTCFDE